MAVTLNSTGIQYSDGSQTNSTSSIDAIGNHVVAFWRNALSADGVIYVASGATVSGADFSRITGTIMLNPFGVVVSSNALTSGFQQLSGTWRCLSGGGRSYVDNHTSNYTRFAMLLTRIS
ncbi:MAG: hypothetical protein WBI20_14810 [Burkholderiaceae bacterium]